jgi:hypothetical protein
VVSTRLRLILPRNNFQTKDRHSLVSAHQANYAAGMEFDRLQAKSVVLEEKNRRFMSANTRRTEMNNAIVINWPKHSEQEMPLVSNEQLPNILTLPFDANARESRLSYETGQGRTSTKADTAGGSPSVVPDLGQHGVNGMRKSEYRHSVLASWDPLQQQQQQHAGAAANETHTVAPTSSFAVGR